MGWFSNDTKYYPSFFIMHSPLYPVETIRNEWDFVPCVLNNWDIPKYIQGTNTAFKMLSKLTAVGIPGYLNFINDPNNKSPITQVIPIASKISTLTEDSLKFFVKQFVNEQREPKPIDDDVLVHLSDCLIYPPKHEVTDVTFVLVGTPTDMLEKFTTHEWLEWQTYVLNMYWSYCCPTKEPGCDSWLADWSWGTKSVRLLKTMSNRIADTVSEQPHSDSGFYPIIVSQISKMVRTNFTYMANNGTIQKVGYSDAFLAPYRRIYVEYKYYKDTYLYKESEESFIERDINTPELCEYHQGEWDETAGTNGRCIRQAVFHVDISQMVQFYKDNPTIYKNNPDIKPVIAEYLNTEISAIPPIPLRMENKHFDDVRYFSQEHIDTVTKIMNFFSLDAKQVKEDLMTEVLASLKQRDSHANNSWIDNLFITFEVSVDSVEQYNIKYLFLFFKKIADNTIGGENIVISLTSGSYRFNLHFDKLEVVEEDIDITIEFPRNALDEEQEYYSNYLLLDNNLPRKTRKDLNTLADTNDTTIFRPTNRYNIPSKFKLFTVQGDVIEGYRRITSHFTYKYYKQDGLIGFREVVGNGTEPKAGDLRFIKPNKNTNKRTVVKVTNLKIARFIRDSTYTKFTSTIVSTASANVDGFSVPLSPRLLQINDFTEFNKIAVVKGSMAATVYIANVKVVRTKWWKKSIEGVSQTV